MEEETSCRSPCPAGSARAAAKGMRDQKQTLRGERRFFPCRGPRARRRRGRLWGGAARSLVGRRPQRGTASPARPPAAMACERVGLPFLRHFLFWSSPFINSPFCLRPTLRCFRAARRCRRQSACLKRADAAAKPPPQRTMLPTHLPVDRLPSPPPHAPYRPRSGACGPAQCSRRGKGLPAYRFSPLPAPAMRKFSACPRKAGEGHPCPGQQKRSARQVF